MKIKMMVLSLLCAFTALAEGEFKAGFARVDITPPMGVPMPGYFYKRLADKVIDPLVAECVAVKRKMLFAKSQIWQETAIKKSFLQEFI